MEPIKEYSKILLSLDNCIVPKERLLNTPSRQDGVGCELEVKLRLLGCECIQTAGLLLKLPQVSLRTLEKGTENCFIRPSTNFLSVLLSHCRWPWLLHKSCFRGSTTPNLSSNTAYRYIRLCIFERKLTDFQISLKTFQLHIGSCL